MLSSMFLLNFLNIFDMVRPIDLLDRTCFFRAIAQFQSAGGRFILSKYKFLKKLAGVAERILPG